MPEAEAEAVLEEDLRYEPFAPTIQVRDFDSGEPDLDEFLNKDEVAEYQKAGYGVTTLVYHKGELVGFFTTSTSDLRVEKVKKVKSFSIYPEVNVENIPSLLIGRFAVQKKWQGKKIGTFMMRRIVAEALDLSRKHGVRLLTLNAKKGSAGFYEGRGFAYTDEKQERGRRERTMFFDLKALEHVP